MLGGETKQIRFISCDVSLCNLSIICHVGFMYVDENGLRTSGCLHYSRRKMHKAVLLPYGRCGMEVVHSSAHPSSVTRGQANE